MSQETFLGYPIVCSAFTTCTDHQVCRMYRHRNYRRASESVPAKNGNRSRAEEQAKRRAASARYRAKRAAQGLDPQPYNAVRYLKKPE